MEKQHTVLGKVLFLVLLFALSLGAGLTAQAAENEGAVTARPIVANPPKSNVAPSSVYGQTSSKRLPIRCARALATSGTTCSSPCAL